MITIGTDCSGIEAPIEALKQLGIPFQHKWACEKDKFARQSILANYQPEILYNDITQRDHSQLPDVDIYVCGFPCQSFSLMGKKLGTKDPRSNIMLHCIDVIKIKRPSIFILENVKNLKFIEKGKPFNYLLDQLNKIMDEKNDPVYNIYYDILNTKDYGIPQNRERIFIIGIKKNIQMNDYTMPNKLPVKNFNDFIIDKRIHENKNIPNTILKKLSKINFKKDYICCCDGIGSIMYNISPTLTFSGCKYMYHTTYNRYLLPQECLLLQGFPSNFKNIVGNVKLCNQIGNSMSVNVLKAIFTEIFKSTLFNIFV
jgi:DNA (cytosine-5)-methyltransferase 1